MYAPLPSNPIYQISESINFIGAVWDPIPASKSWIFDSDGEKRLYIKFADANGLESAPVSDSIIVDTTPPANGSIAINNNASATNSTTVTLTLSATDATTSVTQMKISNNPDFTDSLWEPFTNKRTWNVPLGDGTKNIFVKFRDIVGNESAGIVASLILDTAIPENPSISIQEGPYTNTKQIHLNLSASGASLVKISEVPNFSGASPVPYATYLTWTLSSGDSNKTIYAKYIDDVGNETDPVSVSIVLDTSSPTIPVIFNKDQITNQATFEMTLSADSTDTNFANYQLKGGQYPDWTDTAETSAFGFTLTLQGQNILSIRGKDMAGNTGNIATVTITLDTVNPVLSNIKASGGVTYATITWKTDEPTTGKVDLGLNENYGTTVEDLNFTTDHSVTINDLAAETLYHYRIISTDVGSNIIGSTDLIFTTLRVMSVTLGDQHSCALSSSGKVKCWGYNVSGQLGDGTTTVFTPTPVDVQGLSSGIIEIDAGHSHTCALTTSGGVKCWGNNSDGQIGDGTTTKRPTPVDVVGLSSGVAAISAGGRHTCALTLSGGIKCWGKNSYGQIGNSSNVFSSTPVDVTGLSIGVITLCAGSGSGDYSGHTCAITNSGGGKCWGANSAGQLGDGTTIESRPTPVDVSGLH